MIFIIGGSYQGKLDFAREHCRLSENEIEICTEATAAPDAGKRCIARIEEYALNAVRAGREPADWFRAHRDELKDSVLIATDVACGVVPIDPQLRAWREACGRMNSYLAGQADEVWRLFCGLPQRLK